MVSVKNLVFSYDTDGREIIRNIDFEIASGEIFGFLGPSGAGKSTAQKILTGQLKRYGGSVMIDGVEIKNSSRDIYNRIGVAFEFPNLYEKLTALENLTLFKSFYSVNTIDPVSLLKMVNLYDDRNSLVSSFSKGMKMRLNFARSIMNNPSLLFLDEPTSGLDPVTARMIKDIIVRLREAGTTIFLTTHNMHDAEFLCDRLALIHNGKLVVAGSPEDLKIQFGEKKLKVSSISDGERKEQEFDFGNGPIDPSFFDIIKDGNFETIHTCEANLEDIFIKVTGQSLTSVSLD